MLKNEADGVAYLEAHEDPEVFRLRLGMSPVFPGFDRVVLYG